MGTNVTLIGNIGQTAPPEGSHGSPRSWLQAIVGALYITVTLIQIETALAMFGVLLSVTGSILVAALTPGVYLVVGLALTTVERPLPRRTRLVFNGLSALCLPFVWLIAGAQVQKQSIMDEYYLHAAETYAIQVADHRETELEQEAASLNCPLSSDTAAPKRNKKCGVLRTQFQAILSLRRLLKDRSEDPLPYAQRIYTCALRSECDIPAHSVRFDALRAIDPRRPRVDAISLVWYAYCNWPSSTSLAPIIFMAVLLLLHMILISIEWWISDIRAGGATSKGADGDRPPAEPHKEEPGT